MSIALLEPGIASEFTENDVDHNFDCGEECVACQVRVLRGQQVTGADISQRFRDQGFPTRPGTMAWELIQALGWYGIQADRCYTMSDAMSQVEAGHYVILLVQSNGTGWPEPAGSTAIAHWVVLWGKDDALRKWYVANPGPGDDHQVIDYEYLANCYLGDGVVTTEDCSGHGGVSPMTPDERAMFDAFRQSVWRAVGHLAYYALGREETDENLATSLVNSPVGQEVNTLAQWVDGAPEAKTVFSWRWEQACFDVAALYLLGLHRWPDDAGLSYWAGRLYAEGVWAPIGDFVTMARKENSNAFA